MITRWDLGDDVRVVRNVRNDGTYPGEPVGALLIRRGSTGAVIDIGTFLQDQIIYTVHFLDVDRIVGCREEELIGLDEPWFPSVFESREKVRTNRILALASEIHIPSGAVGEVLHVVRKPDGILYHIHFDCLTGRTLAVPESALDSLSELHHV